jgi:hypothetical protein
MILEAAIGVRPTGGLLRYLRHEHSFHFDPASPSDLLLKTGGSGVTSVLVDTVQLEVGVETGLLLYPWGYSPETSWRTGQLLAPTFADVGLRVKSERGLHPGVSLYANSNRNWTTTFDEENGWIRLALDDQSGDSAFLIAESSGLELRAGALQAVWLSPVFE